MKLTDRFRNRGESQAPRGFDFAASRFSTFSSYDAFLRVLHDQIASMELLNVSHVTRIGIDGTVEGVESDGMRLTARAFGQICHICKLPVSYVKALAKRDEALALQVVEEAVLNMLTRDEGKALVVDTRDGVVDAVIDEHSYNFVSNEVVFDLAMSVSKDVEMCRAYMQGVNVRLAIVDATRTIEPKVGDVVKVGTDIVTDVGAETFLKATGYTERLKCTNGMCARDKTHTEKLSARNDVVVELPPLILRTVGQGELLGPMMKASAENVLDERSIDRMTSYLSNPAQGGNRTLLTQAVQGAQREAREDGRDDGELTVWDFVNGVTDAAKSAKTLSRRLELEGMGFNVMRDFYYGVKPRSRAGSIRP